MQEFLPPRMGDRKKGNRWAGSQDLPGGRRAWGEADSERGREDTVSKALGSLLEGPPDDFY